MSKTLLVWPNPFHAVDHEGKPAGVLPYEPVGNGVTTFDERRFVGALLKSEVLQKFPRGDARENVQRTWFEFADEAVRVPSTPYYKAAIARGEIFAADAPSAKLCGIVDSFLEPGPLLERARDEAIGELKRMGHEGIEDEVFTALRAWAFGPMKEAVEARKKADAEAKKAAEKADAEAKDAAKKVEDAKKKAEADKAAQNAGGK